MVRVMAMDMHMRRPHVHPHLFRSNCMAPHTSSHVRGPGHRCPSHVCPSHRCPSHTVGVQAIGLQAIELQAIELQAMYVQEECLVVHRFQVHLHARTHERCAHTCNGHTHTHTDTLSKNRQGQHTVAILFQARYLPRHWYAAAMPPKEGYVRVQSHSLGNAIKQTISSGAFWRLRARPNGRLENGPRRTTKAAAEADLVAARRATTHEQYASTVRDICTRARHHSMT